MSAQQNLAQAQEEIAKLKKELEESRHREYCLRQDAKGHSPSEVQEYRDEIEELKKQVEQKDADWNDWLNKAFGDDLYPISPSPEPDEFVAKVKELKRKATMYEYMAEYMEKADEFWCYFEWVKEKYPDKFVEAGGIVDSDEEVEDNDPEEYGEYTWKEGLTAEEIAKVDKIDPETGEEKIDLEKEELLLKAQIQGGVAPRTNWEEMVKNIRDYLFDCEKFEVGEIEFERIANEVDYEETKKETEERYYEERPHLKEEESE